MSKEWIDADKHYIATLQDERLNDMQYALDEAKSLLASAIDGVKDYSEFNYLRDALETALDEARECERSLENGEY